MSSLAYWRSTLYFSSSSCDLTALPSAIQRSEVWVGIETPIVRSEGSLSAVSFELPPAPLPPQAVRPIASAAPRAVSLSFLFIATSLLRDICRPMAQARLCASGHSVNANNPDPSTPDRKLDRHGRVTTRSRWSSRGLLPPAHPSGGRPSAST